MGYTAVAVFALIVQQGQASAARRREARARDAQARIEQAKEARAKRQAIREERIRRAGILARTQAQGAAGSSAEATAVGSLGTQLGANIGFQRQVSREQQTVFREQGAAAAYQGRAQLWGAISNVASRGASSYGGSPPAQQERPTQSSGFRFYEYQ